MAKVFNKFSTFVQALAEQAHDLENDTLKIALTDTAPTAATDTGFLPASSHPVPAAANGYPSRGNAVVANGSLTGSTYKLTINNTTFTASGGAIGPFRYLLLYNETATNDELIGYWDNGSSITLQAGETFTVDFDASTGALTLA